MCLSIFTLCSISRNWVGSFPFEHNTLWPYLLREKKPFVPKQLLLLWLRYIFQSLVDWVKYICAKQVQKSPRLWFIGFILLMLNFESLSLVFQWVFSLVKPVWRIWYIQKNLRVAQVVLEECCYTHRGDGIHVQFVFWFSMILGRHFVKATILGRLVFVWGNTFDLGRKILDWKPDFWRNFCVVGMIWWANFFLGFFKNHEDLTHQDGMASG